MLGIEVYFYLFVLFIDSFIYVCFLPLNYLALVRWVLIGGLGWGAHGWIAVWAGHSGVLLPWGVTLVAVPGPFGH